MGVPRVRVTADLAPGWRGCASAEGIGADGVF